MFTFLLHANTTAPPLSQEKNPKLCSSVWESVTLVNMGLMVTFKQGYLIVLYTVTARRVQCRSSIVFICITDIIIMCYPLLFSQTPLRLPSPKRSCFCTGTTYRVATEHKHTHQPRNGLQTRQTKYLNWP